MNPQTTQSLVRLAGRRRALEIRARMLQSLRAFFIGGGFLEVETPVRIPAPAPELHIDAVPCGDAFLQTSPELCMKQLLAAGYGKIFQVCRCFREGERGRLHLPEFTMVEWYRADADYTALMEDCRALVLLIADDLGAGKKLRWGGAVTDLAAPWERLTVREAFARHAGMGADEALAAGLFDEKMVTAVEPHLGRTAPTLLCDYPAPLAALSRLKPGDTSVAERFELYIAGLELANGFSELTDATEQKRRFAADAEARGKAGRTVYPSPAPFLAALPSLPPSAGIALGFDRLVMLFAGAESIDEVTAFTPEEL